MSIGQKTTSRRVQSITAWTAAGVATLKLKWWQLIQGGLISVTAAASLFILSFLGVETSRYTSWEDYVDHQATNKRAYAIGWVGAATVGLACIIQAVMIYRENTKYHAEQQLRDANEDDNSNLNREQSSRSGRALSAGEMQDGMLLGALL
ncbi:hypothetical protein TrLO_g9762 [Triparma laevis f. longispina]|nr:hypothetical protein TrLO_g9762 [Triparma laevis f. longispina]